jgi:hypothetical protein
MKLRRAGKVAAVISLPGLGEAFVIIGTPDTK